MISDIISCIELFSDIIIGEDSEWLYLTTCPTSGTIKSKAPIMSTTLLNLSRLARQAAFVVVVVVVLCNERARALRRMLRAPLEQTDSRNNESLV